MSMNDEDKTMFAMRISRKEKNELRKLYGDMGLDLSTAVNLFFKQSLVENGLPFQPTRFERTSREAKRHQ
ncbi:type II toxin-antitoxin system RelB/DinJ family antitoxin [Lactiplantibacillus plantarum]|uniref:type II toxin-antitoxin system RelB/DinJ family antitoxin n=1 Tax=Lactiplantibacillus plantarum TaxID=1590 RepID=UPI0020BFCBFD|nr:type II toxin-antitoxin system RelB/DinJ family antitoxin [Lactiplantibacillus plantarum]MCK8450506.1 type II toxin-antitoxin system RelB/DinJ family antitoxin [Lactiplantibacillus plantarum]